MNYRAPKLIILILEFASINKINKNLPNESVKNCNLINLMLNF